MAYGTRAGFEPLRSVAFGSLTGTYAPLGSIFSGHVRIATFNNSTNQDVLFSLDGTTDHIRIVAGTSRVFEFATNRISEDGFFLPEGTQIYVKYATSPSSGAAWVETVNAVAGGV